MSKYVRLCMLLDFYFSQSSCNTGTPKSGSYAPQSETWGTGPSIAYAHNMLSVILATELLQLMHICFIT